MTLFCVLKNNSGIHKNKILKTRKTTRKSFRKFPNVNNSQTAPISGKSFPTSFTSTPPPLPQLIECVFPFAPLDLWQSTRTEGFSFSFSFTFVSIFLIFLDGRWEEKLNTSYFRSVENTGSIKIAGGGYQSWKKQSKEINWDLGRQSDSWNKLAPFLHNEICVHAWLIQLCSRNWNPLLLCQEGWSPLFETLWSALRNR